MTVPSLFSEENSMELTTYYRDSVISVSKKLSSLPTDAGWESVESVYRTVIYKAMLH